MKEEIEKNGNNPHEERKDKRMREDCLAVSKAPLRLVAVTFSGHP